jgi:FtsP/CotA-like multicopper oxidase with cupredoxin domain
VDRLVGASMVGGDWLREPLRLQSRGGVLALTLEAAEREVFVAGTLRKAIVYNGRLPGPTLVVDPGDRIALTLVNHLYDATNLHTHGFHVSPEGNSDNVLLHVQPGETFEFRFDLPGDHAPGMNWYHPHAHGHGTRQMFGGMAGAVIFRSRFERRGALPAMRDRVLVLQAPEWITRGSSRRGRRDCSPARCASSTAS